MKALLYISMLLALSACYAHKETPEVGQINKLASLPASFDFNKMGLKVITSTVNKSQGTMSTLYGNDSAIATAKGNNGTCLQGFVFALVTWKQQPDKRWIGGNIPGELLSVEMIKQSTGQQQASVYSRLKGNQLRQDTDTSGQSARTRFILSLKPSIMF